MSAPAQLTAALYEIQNASTGIKRYNANALHPEIISLANASDNINRYLNSLAPPSPPPLPPTSALAVPAAVLALAPNLQRAFFDDFAAGSLTSQWTDHNGWKNQNGVTDNSTNVHFDGQELHLTLASNLSGAAIESVGYGLPVGGYVEALVMFAGNGKTIYNWPAWWVSGPGWPASGEHDIAEGLGTLTENYHSPSGAHNHGTYDGVVANVLYRFGLYRAKTWAQTFIDGQPATIGGQPVKYATDDNGARENLIFTMGAGHQAAYGEANGSLVCRGVAAWE